MKIKALSVVLVSFLGGFVNHAAAQETKLRWFGHAAFSITTPKGKVLLIDPWLNNPTNPEAKNGKDPLKLKVGFYEMKPGEIITFSGRQMIKSKLKQIANATRGYSFEYFVIIVSRICSEVSPCSF